MQQIGIDISSLPEVNGFRYIVLCIDYFTKWSEAKPLKDTFSLSVAEFLYEIICRHGCPSTQINDQGRELVNEVSNHLHRMTGTKQRITSAYHPQANGLCERQNRSIKEALVKVLDENPEDWPYVIDGILFAHRVSRHYSTKFFQFFMLYNREPVLPIDVKYGLNPDGPTIDYPFDLKTFKDIYSVTQSMRTEVHAKAGQNITKAQDKQKRDYNRRHAAPTKIQVGDEILLKNLKREDGKGGKFSYKWLGPYIVNKLSWMFENEAHID